jgi:hypothetical protein
MDVMTVRRGPLYVGVFLLAAGGVTLAVAGGLLDRTAVANTVATLWPLAVIAIGVGLVLRRSPAALAAGLVAALIPGLALGATVVAAPAMPIACTEAAAPVGAAVVRDGAFAGTATVDLSVNCGELDLATQPGNAWHVEARDGTERRTDIEAGPSRLALDAERGRGRWGFGAGPVAWDVVLPTGSTLDLATHVNAGSARLDLAAARLGDVDLEVNAGDLRVDLTGATLARLDLGVNAGSASIVLPADSFEGDLEANAGSLALCAPDQLGLRVRSTANLGSVDMNGLVQRGGAWETPGYATASSRADLTIDASVGSVTINPVGGCK